MELVRQSFQIERIGGGVLTRDYGQQILQFIESAGRTCYKSEEKNPTLNWEKTENFVKSIMRRGHLSVIEHVGLTVRFISNRGMTHEDVRHRLCSYSQESTRYCNYGNDHVKFIIPPWSENLEPGVYETFVNTPPIKLNSEWTDEEYLWMKAMANAEISYQQLIMRGMKPQFARGVLPIDLKTEIVHTANLREWRHIFNMRCAKTAHPQIRELMLGVLSEFNQCIPVIFEDIAEKFLENKGELGIQSL